MALAFRGHLLKLGPFAEDKIHSHTKKLLGPFGTKLSSLRSTFHGSK